MAPVLSSSGAIIVGIAPPAGPEIAAAATTTTSSSINDTDARNSRTSPGSTASPSAAAITTTAPRRLLTATSSTTGGLLAFSTNRSSSPGRSSLAAGARCRLSAQKSIDVIRLGENENSQREQRRAALLSTRTEGSPRVQRSSRAPARGRNATTDSPCTVSERASVFLVENASQERV
ncbi:putative GPI-anchored protein pfl2 [Varroa jacobsoni]|uniref:putative GPI-anchored protein pfl2 n=1 Tax=Varroa jacobsoni TaxID=62625 RepID=UPI000BF6CED3|nr:putative GPI-anchored protein pfl2 [Varroa jacobsoni]